MLLDGGDDVAARASDRLAQAGWTRVSVVEGGIPGWTAASLPLIPGEHSFSKAFGEWVQRRFGVPEVGPDDLASAMEGAAPPMLVDGRPFAEHRSFTLPGSVSCPNPELGLRMAAATQGGREVVVHCAGRTRSIIGAQTLRDFGLSNTSAALRNGTQGWDLSGRARDVWADRPVPGPSPAETRAAVVRAREVMIRHRVPAMDAATLSQTPFDNSSRSLVLRH